MARDTPAAPGGLRRVIAVALLGSLCLNVIGLAMPLFSMTVYDKVVPHGAFDTLAAMLVIALGLVVLDWSVRLARAIMLDRLADELAANAQLGAYESLLSARADVMPANAASMSAILRDGDDVRSGFAAGVASSVVDASFALLYVVTVIAVGGRIALVPLLAVSVLAAIAYYGWRRQHALRAPAANAAALRHGVLTETVRAATMLRRWQQHDTRRDLWRRVTEAHAKVAQASRRNASRVSTVQTAAQNAAMIATLGIGTPAAVSGAISVGTLVACVLLTTRTVATAAGLANTVPRLATARLALQSASRMAGLPREDGERVVSLAPGQGGLFLDRIAVRYPGADHPVLRELSLSLSAGQHLAVTGASGSGKSTLERTLFGELPLESGRILLDGTDLSVASKASLRRGVIGIPQQVDVLAGSLRDNVALGREIDDARIADALERLGPAGRSLLATGYRLDRAVPEGGRGLSGGQMQAIAIARILVDDYARLAIFDEPTTGLDNDSENAALTALEEWIQGRTALVMTHRQAVATRLAQGFVILEAGALRLPSTRPGMRHAG